MIGTDAEERTSGGGRYCYCLVNYDRSGDGAGDGPTVDREALSGVAGIDGADPYLVGVDGVAAVVHERDEVYESDDPDRVKRWLVAHQSVVDAAAERFGTPLPFRFDVVIEGGDDAVVGWIGENADRIDDHLSEFAGRWEYRVAVEWAEGADDYLRSRDDRLADLADRRADGGGGRSYLVGKQYESRLREVRAERAEELTDDLLAAVDPVVEASTIRDDPPALAEGDPDPVVRLAVLADGDDETELGERLDGIAAEPDVVVRFTGPWPPYTFAPQLGE